MSIPQAVPRITGTTLSHYRVLEWLGEGATAVVYRAEDLSLGRPVALKLLPAALTVDLGTVARFQHEARTTSTLNHPNICTIYEVDQHDGRHFLAMEYLEGRSLAKVINGRPLDAYRLVELAIQIADGLEAAHEARVVHRDLKPANIYVTARDHVKLLDFGLATLLPAKNAEREVSTAAWLSERGGTGPYMSPEQTLGEPIDTRSDLFALGVVLYEMATGARPFTGLSHAALVDAIRNERQFPARDLNTAVPEELDRIINKALEKNRRLRYQTASDISADLRRLKRDLDANPLALGRPSVAATDDTSPEPPRPPRSTRINGWRAAQLLGAAALGGVLAAVGLPARTPSAITPVPPVGAQRAAPHHAGAEAPAYTVLSPHAGAEAPAYSVPSSHAGAAAPAYTGAEAPPSVTAVAAPIAVVTPPRNATVAPGAPPPAGASAAKTPLAVTDASSPRVTSPRHSGFDLEQQIQVAEKKAELALYEQAVTTLQDAIRLDGGSPAAPAAYLSLAAIQRRHGRPKEAIATYVDLTTRFAGDPRAAEGLYAMADTLLASRRDDEARRILTDLAARYPQTPWAARALMTRAAIEERRNIRETDALLGREVPAALVSYRLVAEHHRGAPEREHALWRLAHLYSQLKRYDLAVAGFQELGTRYSTSTYDSWFLAGELYEKRLNDRDRARSAYAQVPASSPRWQEAQKRLGAAR